MDNRIDITNIQRFSIHDGDGIRTTVFFKGCPLRCLWCHNPETKHKEEEIFYTEKLCIMCGACAAVCRYGAHETGTEHIFHRDRCIKCGECADACPANALEKVSRKMSIREILDEVERDRAFYGEDGGITLSGGEPMMAGEKTLELLREAKKEGLNTAVETCGYFNSRYIPELVKLTDLFLYDIKDTDNERHIRNTGVSNETIINNLRYIDSLGGKSIMRCVMVNGINTGTEHIKALSELYKSLANCRGIELMPYHAMGGSKSVRLGKEDDGHREWIPDKTQLDDIKKHLSESGAAVI